MLSLCDLSSEQTFEDGDMALLDMGAEFKFYGSDITCSFPVSICFCIFRGPSSHLRKSIIAMLTANVPFHS